jgi:hypothetical protein
MREPKYFCAKTDLHGADRAELRAETIARQHVATKRALIFCEHDVS